MKSSAIGGALSALALFTSLPAVADNPTAITLVDSGQRDALGRAVLTGGDDLLSGYSLAVRKGPSTDTYVVSLKTPGDEHRAAFFVRDSHGTGIGVGAYYLNRQHLPGEYDGELLPWQRVDRDIDGDGRLDTEYRIGDSDNGYVVQLIDDRGVVVDDDARRDIYCETERTRTADGAVTQEATFWLPGMDGRMGYVGLRNHRATPSSPWEQQRLQVLAADWTGNDETMQMPTENRLVQATEAMDQHDRAFLFVDGWPSNSFSGSGADCAIRLRDGTVDFGLIDLEPARPTLAELPDLLIKMSYTLSGTWAAGFHGYQDYSDGTDTWVLLSGENDRNQPIAWLGKIQHEREYARQNSTRLRYLFDEKLLRTLVPGNHYRLQAFMEVTTNLAATRAGAAAEKRLTPLRSLAEFTVEDGSGGATASP